MFEILTTDGRARRGVLHTVHGDIQTPVFMNVGTCAAKDMRHATVCPHIRTAGRLPWSSPGARSTGSLTGRGSLSAGLCSGL